MTLVRVCISLAMSVLLCACATGNGAGRSQALELPVPGPLTTTPVRPDYRIGPNDLINVKVFRVEDLDREVRVDNRGQVSLPLIGNVDAAGSTARELQARIEAAYLSRFLQDPQVSVFVTDFASRRVTVEGAVASPGIYPIATQLSLLQAIALAQGPTNVADEGKVLVFRDVGGQRHFVRFDLNAIRQGSAVDPEILGEDIVVVDESSRKVWLRRFIELTPLIGVWAVLR